MISWSTAWSHCQHLLACLSTTTRAPSMVRARGRFSRAVDTQLLCDSIWAILPLHCVSHARHTILITLTVTTIWLLGFIKVSESVGFITFFCVGGYCRQRCYKTSGLVWVHLRGPSYPMVTKRVFDLLLCAPPGEKPPVSNTKKC